MSEWRPIESAPKDGTEIDLWATGYGRKPNMFWRPVYTWGSKRKPIVGWTDDWYGRGTIYSENQFTHWMPLPDPPQ